MHYSLDTSIDFSITYLLESDVSDGYRYPAFEQLGQGREGGLLQFYSTQ